MLSAKLGILKLSAALLVLSLGVLQAATAQAQAPTKPSPQEELEELGKLPKLELSQEIFGRVLAAEIAAQRGYHALAAQTYLSLGKETNDPRLAKRAMEMAVRARNGEQAMQAAKLWQQNAPQSKQAEQSVLFWQIVTGRLDEAEPLLKKRLQSASKNEREQLITDVQQSLTNAPDRRAAHAFLLKFVTQSSELKNSSGAQLALTRSAYGVGDFNSAQQFAEEALRLQPSSSDAVLALAQLMQLKNQTSGSKRQVTEFLQQFLQRNPQSREVRQTLAQLYQQDGRGKEAGKEIETLLQQTPKDSSLLLAMARLNIQNNQPTIAESYLKRYLEALEKPAEDDADAAASSDKANELIPVFLALGQLAEDRKGWREALTWYEKVTSGEAYITALSRRASVLQKTGEINAARQLLQTAQVPSDKEKAQLVLAEVAILRDAKQENLAQQVLENSLARFPSDPDILYEYALGLEKQNQLELMESTLRQVMALRPQDAQAYNALGYSLADRDVRLPEALALIERALSLQPNDAMIIDSLGWVQYRLGNLEKAIELLQRAYTARPDTEIGAHLGEALWQAGQRDAARQVWREAEQREPDNQVLRETQRRLQATQ